MNNDDFNAESQAKEKIAIPPMLIAKLMNDIFFTKDAKKIFYQKYRPLALREGQAMKDSIQNEIGDVGDDWDMTKNSQSQIQFDAIMNTVETAVAENLDAGFNQIKEMVKKEIAKTVREEL